MNTNYSTDFYSWTQEQARLLRAGNLSAVDIENLAEEIESMGSSQESDLESRIEVLLMHLLKWFYQPDYEHKKSWQLTIREQVKRIERRLIKNPGLKNKLPEIIPESYEFARDRASGETAIKLSVFPESCPWDFDTFMHPQNHPDIWPDYIP